MKLFRSKEQLIGFGITLLVILLYTIVPSPFHEIEKNILAAKYRFRGAVPADSSIIIVYLNNDDIDALGGLPIKRNYYALLIHALHDLDAAVIAVDIAFTEPDTEYPEYDNLLSSVVKLSGNVVLGGYFRSVSDDSRSQTVDEDSLLNRFMTGTCGPFKLRWGAELETPFPQLMNSAAGFGHTNITDNNNIPLLIAVDSGKYLQSFGFTIVLRGLSSGKNTMSGDTVERGLLSIPASPNGGATSDIMINYTGDIQSFRLISAVSFLKEYDEMKAGGPVSPNMSDIKGKIVLTGIMAEGRSMFIETPFAQQFPSIGMHATFISNVLQNNFLHGGFLGQHPRTSNSIIIVIMGLLCTFLMMYKREAIGLLGVVVSLAGISALSFILFSTQSYVISIVPSFAVAFAVSITLLWYKHQVVRTRVDELSREKENISGTLAEKELTLEKLQQKLASSLNQQSDARNLQLLDEIREYKAEVDRLKGMADDLRPFAPDEPKEGTRQIFHGIIYHSNGPIAQVVGFIKKIANTNATVLILGESGTGKELVAKAIHQQSQRNSKPFIAVNCGALSESLLESELFGHERGAFTGAVKDRQGRFELADGGTIFLDEIGETSEAFQVKLLRVLQDGTLERVGAAETRKVDVRVIAATNRDLKQSVEQKKFREDLYYRLNGFNIQLPPLRERANDIPLLVDYYVASEHPGIQCSESVMDTLLRYTWKGNIRELQSVIKRAVVMASSEGRTMLRAKDLPAEITSSTASTSDLEEQIVALLREKEFSRSAISETADDLGGLNRGTVAEYFRGYVFKTFAASNWDLRAAVETIAGTRDMVIVGRVQKKAAEYLANAVQFVDPSRSFDEITTLSQPKYKNLPQRYHLCLDEVISSAFQGKWSIDFHAINNDPSGRLNS